MPRRSVTDAVRAREAQNPPSKRVLRSNTDDEPAHKVEELPPPPEFDGQYFYRNFGAHGVFVGKCIRMVPKGHRNGRDDAYFVRYDDGDIEDLCYSDLKRMCRRGPATEEAYLEASEKRAKALEEARVQAQLREAEARAKQLEEVAKNVAKPEKPKPSAAVPVKPRSTPATKQEDGGAAAVSAQADASTTASAKGRKGKRPQVKRKARASLPDPAEEIIISGPPPAKTLRTGLGWFNHTPCPVVRIEGSRVRPTKEYLVRWNMIGQDATWEPIHNLHAQLTNDYELQLQQGGMVDGRSAALAPAAGVAAAMDIGIHPGVAGPATPAVSLGAATVATFGAAQEMPPGHADAQHLATLTHELATLRGQHSELAESYRALLAYLEPRGWAATSHSVRTLSQDKLHSFPRGEFLKYVEHEQAEKRIEAESMIQAAEKIRLEAEKKAEAAEAKLEDFLARQTQH